MRQKFLFFLILLLVGMTLLSKGSIPFKKLLEIRQDSAYIQNNSRDLILRIYASHKYSTQKINDRGEKTALDYHPANGYVVGLGFNYKFLGINLGTVFPFAQPDLAKFGKTKYLDFQSHLYLRILTIDFYSGYYKGMYLDNTSQVITPAPVGSAYYTRGDIATYSGGFGVYANLNPSKYSVRASFLQNEWQKISAGQAMLGMELYWVGSSADSSFIPAHLTNKNFFEGKDFNKWRFYSMNITGGYSYTLVIRKRFFIMAGLNGSLGLGEYRLSLINRTNLYRIYPNISLNQKFGIGYHFNRLFVGMSLASFKYITPTPVGDTYINWNTGNLRFNIAYRISLKRDIEIRPWKWFAGNHLKKG